MNLNTVTSLKSIAVDRVLVNNGCSSSSSCDLWGKPPMMTHAVGGENSDLGKPVVKELIYSNISLLRVNLWHDLWEKPSVMTHAVGAENPGLGKSARRQLINNDTS